MNEECIANKSKQKEYLSTKYYKVQLIYNYEVFDPEKYNEASILKQSGLSFQRFTINLSEHIYFEQQV